jgi:hypothetical protein
VGGGAEEWCMFEGGASEIVQVGMENNEGASAQVCFRDNERTRVKGGGNTGDFGRNPQLVSRTGSRSGEPGRKRRGATQTRKDAVCVDGRCSGSPCGEQNDGRSEQLKSTSETTRFPIPPTTTTPEREREERERERSQAHSQNECTAELQASLSPQGATRHCVPTVDSGFFFFRFWHVFCRSSFLFYHCFTITQVCLSRGHATQHSCPWRDAIRITFFVQPAGCS